MKLAMKWMGGCILLLLFVIACDSAEPELPPDEVTLQLKWLHQAQFAGFYVAQENGYYAEENINITFAEGGPGVAIAEQVLTGNADFGVAAPEDIFSQRNQGNPVVAIATIFRRNPTVFAFLPDSGIEQPSDFLGRRVAAEGVIEFNMQFEALVKTMALDIEQIEIVPHNPNAASLVEGETDVIVMYSTGGLILARQQGYELNVIWPEDYNVHMYADTLIVTEEMIAENPDLILRFLRATLHGWRDALENPETAVSATLKYAPESDLETQTLMMAASLPLIHTGEDQIGWMRPQIWEGMNDILVEQGFIEQSFPFESTFTMQFLEEIYGKNP